MFVISNRLRYFSKGVIAKLFFDIEHFVMYLNKFFVLKSQKNKKKINIMWGFCYKYI